MFCRGRAEKALVGRTTLTDTTIHEIECFQAYELAIYVRESLLTDLGLQ
jgi:hypothetical protein